MRRANSITAEKQLYVGSASAPVKQNENHEKLDAGWQVLYLNRFNFAEENSEICDKSDISELLYLVS